MATAWLPINKPECIGNRLETLDAPIARIGLHLFESLCGPRHRDMILQVTLHIKDIMLRIVLSSNAKAHLPLAAGAASG